MGASGERPLARLEICLICLGDVEARLRRLDTHSGEMAGELLDLIERTDALAKQPERRAQADGRCADEATPGGRGPRRASVPTPMRRDRR